MTACSLIDINCDMGKGVGSWQIGETGDGVLMLV